MQNLTETLKVHIDEKNVSALRTFCENNPDLDLNHIGSAGVSALWWALHPKNDETVSISVLRYLLETRRLNPTQTWYGMRLREIWPDADSHAIDAYEDQYVDHQRQNAQPAQTLQNIANNRQNTHDPLIVQQYDEYIENLKQRYGLPNQGIPEGLRRFIVAHAQDSSIVKAALQRIQADTSARGDLSNGMLLHLVWQALCDTRAESYAPDTDFSATAQNERKAILLGHLIQAQTEYGPHNPACFMGTRHLIISTLDKIHIDCSHTRDNLTAEHIAENYKDYCTEAITHTASRDTYCGFFLEDVSTLQKTTYTALNEWKEDVRAGFWKSIEARQTAAKPKHRLPDSQFQDLAQFYQHSDTALSYGKHPVASVWSRFMVKRTFLNQGRCDETVPNNDVFTTADTLKNWISASHSVHYPNISTYLEQDEVIKSWLSTFPAEEKRVHALALWRVLIDLFLTDSDTDSNEVMLKKSWVEYWIGIHENVLNESELMLWLKALPGDLKEAFIKQCIRSPNQWVSIAFEIALQNQRWQQFPTTLPVTAKDQDFRGNDLSCVDLSSWTFDHCDLRLTGILSNPTLQSQHLYASRIEKNALFLAANNNYLALAVAVLEQNASTEALNEQNSYGDTALMLAALNGHYQTVRAILEKNDAIEVLNAKDSYGDTALRLAARKGHHQVVSAILDKNASPEVMNVKDGYKFTALSLAARAGHHEVVSAILEKNASTKLLNEKNSYGDTTLMLATNLGHHKVVGAILEKNGSTEVLNEKDSYGDTALRLAARKGHHQVVSAILEKNASPEVMNKKDKSGFTALMLAVRMRHDEVVRAILDKNHSIEILNAKDNDGDTAVISATRNGDHQIVSTILEKNASTLVLNKKDNYGNTALMLAVTLGKHGVVNAILAQNVSTEVLNEKDNEGNTALILAANKGYPAIVALLKLQIAINTMEAHVKHQGRDDIGNLLTRMRSCAIRYDACRLQSEQALQIQQEFQTCYDDLVPLTSDSCEYFKTLPINLVIAATGIGLVCLLGNYVLNQRVGFFQTKRGLLDRVQQDFTELSSAYAAHDTGAPRLI